jgi:hypothetical protein
MAVTTINITQNVTTTTLYFNGLSQDRKYELSYGSNITGIVNACTNQTIYLDIIYPAYGVNYTSDTDSEVYYNFNVDAISTDSFNDSTESKSLDLQLENYSYVNLKCKSTISEAQFRMNGSQLGATYPKDVKVNILNNSRPEAMFPGTLTGNQVYKDYFSNNLTIENLTWPIPGATVRYVNYSANSMFHNYPNITLTLTGFAVDPDGIYYTENFYNNTDIYNTTGSAPAYWYDDFTAGEVSGRWSSSTTGSWANPKTVVTDEYIYSSDSSTGGGGCADMTSESATGQFWSTDEDLSDHKQVRFEYYISGSAGCGVTCCIQNSQGSGYSAFGLRDNYGTTYAIRSASAGCSSSWCGTDSDSKTYNDIVTIQFRDDGWIWVRTTEASDFGKRWVYDTDKSYYLWGYGSTQGRYIVGSGSSTTRFSPINFSGYTGNYTGNLQWGGEVFLESTVLHNPTQNITKARLTTYKHNTGGGSETLYLSVDNGTTWESTTSGTTRAFTTGGNTLKVRINITITDVNEPFTIDYYTVEVTPSFISGLDIDVAYDGTAEWNRTAEINNTNSPITITFPQTGINQYIQDNCEDELTCLVPIAFKADTAGGVQVSDMNFTQNLSNVELNDSEIQNNLSECSGSQDVMLHFSSIQDGTVGLYNLQFDYKGDDNVTISANYYGNENYTSSSDTQTMQWRYSPYNATWPSGIDAYNVYPSTVNSKDVMPWGQLIKSTEAASTAMWNVTTTAQTDPVKVYRWYNPEVDACLVLYQCLYSNMTECQTINTTNTTVIIQNLNNTETTGDYQKVYDFWNLTSCNPTSLYLPGTHTFRATCRDCVMTW